MAGALAVVVAGTMVFALAAVPALAGSIGGAVQQVAARHYKNPEGLPEGGEHRTPGDLREVRLQVELESRLRAWQREPANDHHEHQHQEDRHQDLRPALDAVLDAADHDQQ